MLIDVCKEVVLDKQLTQNMMLLVNKEHIEQLIELQKAQNKLANWSLSEWQVETKFQLNIELYA